MTAIELQEELVRSRIRDSQMHYLTGPETIEHRSYDSIPSPPRIYVESNHSGMGKPINFRFVFPLHLQAMAREG